SKATRLAQRSDTPVICAHCSRSVRRKSRQQRFCARKCRVSAHREKTPVQPLKNQPHSRSTPRNLWARVIEVELYGGRDWQRVVSSDGVVSWMTWLRPRPLGDTGE